MHLVKSDIDRDKYFLFDKDEEFEIIIDQNEMTCEKILTDKQRSFICKKLNVISVADKFEVRYERPRIEYRFRKQKTFDNFEDFLINQILKLKNNENNRQTVSDTNRRHQAF